MHLYSITELTTNSPRVTIQCTIFQTISLWHTAILSSTSAQLYMLKVKIKLSLSTSCRHTMGSRRITPHNKSVLGGGKESTSCPICLFAREKISWYPLYRRLDGPQCQSWHFEGRRNPFSLSKSQTPLHPASSLVIIWIWVNCKIL